MAMNLRHGLATILVHPMTALVAAADALDAMAGPVATWPRRSSRLAPDKTMRAHCGSATRQKGPTTTPHRAPDCYCCCQTQARARFLVARATRPYRKEKKKREREREKKKKKTPK
ncbi:hypothetical protein BC940DRAFT_304066 [Gongronella butleri]|nr:hypothetical protein BC940DRAFT_304066 [Gongronella butleri]